MNIKRFLKDFSEKPSFLFVALHGLIGFFISTLVIIRSFAIEPSENIASYNWLLVFPYIFIFNAGFKGIIALFTYLFFAKPAVEFAKNLKTDRRRSNIKLRIVLFILTVGFLSKTFNLSYGNMLLLFIVHKFLTPLTIIICIIPYIFLLIYEYNKKARLSENLTKNSLYKLIGWICYLFEITSWIYLTCYYLKYYFNP